ncbi:MAG: hypothetical protein IKN16_04580 [Selenomonadaceae bacterium]|nr:hypothetical protein [Selenomonadaceae bacterium]
MQTNQLKITTFTARSFTRIKNQSVEFLVLIVEDFNCQHVSFDFSNHFFDGERFLRRFDRLAQELEKFFAVFHDNASKFLTNNRRDVKINARRRLDGFG